MSDIVIRRILATGDTKNFVPTEKREISLVRGGPLAYLWIGNAEKPMFCYATLSGEQSLRKLAEAILRELGKPTIRGGR